MGAEEEFLVRLPMISMCASKRLHLKLQKTAQEGAVFSFLQVCGRRLATDCDPKPLAAPVEVSLRS
jgi:hypothetical protein